MLSLSLPAKADEAEFDPVFLQMVNPELLDLSRFRHGAAMMPGIWRSDIWLNDTQVTRDSVIVRDQPDGGSALCLKPSLIRSLPLTDEILQRDMPLMPGADCTDIRAWLPEADVEYDSSAQRLTLTVPQILVSHTARGTTDPSLWDSGIPALLLGYNGGAWHSESGGISNNSAWLSLNAGLNLGPWYLRHNGNFNWQEQGNQQHYTTLNTWLQRDLPALRGRILAGQANTRGELFDTVPFSGVSLFSDERMLPESRRGYAPEIRGIARTNARVIVRQGEQIIYETTVTPGSFLIDDLYPTGYGGSLQVTVQEADGSEQRFEVPYAAVTQLLRPGSFRYGLTAGTLRDSGLKDKPFFTELTWQQGLTNSLTGYGGAQLAPDYYSFQLGVGVGTPIGAVAADVTHTELNTGSDAARQGQSWRLSYSKYLPETQSNFSLATYRFSTRDYLGLTEAMVLRDSSTGYDESSRPRNRATLTFSQGLGDALGQLYLSGSVQNYWGRQGHDQQYQAGWNVNIGQVSWAMSVTRSRNNNDRFENNWLLSASVPLGSSGYRSSNTPTLRAQLNRDANGRIGESLNLSGTLGELQQAGYGVDVSHHPDNGNAMTLSGSYRSQWTSATASWGKSKNYSSASVGLSGTVIAHSDGVTFSPYSGDTFALVKAEGAEGASVSGYPGIQVDARGYAIVPNLQPYQMNDISIDPKGARDGVELDSTRSRTAPRSGAVVKLDYGVKVGLPLLATLRQADGQPVPFGAEVRDEQGSTVGYIGQAGQLYARVQTPTGQLKAEWGSGSAGQCVFHYHLSETPSARELPQQSISCNATDHAAAVEK
ncbi:fimbria/pilus outer membrane usher protein [Vibrio sp. V38_P2S17PM301]|nr:fimbria/pilus outer membrane usher protein [Vibrio sp. V38_P2S17PM301]